MKASELRAKTSDELTAELATLQKEQFNLRIQRSTGEAPRTHNFRQVRRKIAQIKTILNEKTREGQSS
ncbi:50S ribosomal subunit protein L29 [Gammaproteobacteria bacterium]